jgi:hypothetical protein
MGDTGSTGLERTGNTERKISAENTEATEIEECTN